jgi:hypothetical protein
MTEIECAHRWSFCTYHYALQGTKEAVEVKKCRGCDETWRVNEPEPRIVIGRFKK